MRALRLRGVSFFSQGVLVPLTTPRAWCADQTTKDKVENDTKKTKEEPLLTQEAFAKLEKELENARVTIAELKKDVLYRAAEAENARRIGREDVQKAKSYGITSFGKDMLEVVDTLEKGLEAMSKVSAEEFENNKNMSSIHTGVKLSTKLLLNNLSKHGIEKMSVNVGDTFDPNLHDALMKTSPTPEIPSGHISIVLKGGYKIQERVLRAPQVGVAGDD
ncbi:co-chaperone GrpE [Trypanosoma conorhini]|uniref:Co-chaperone GrpE n=1 Tax=Trypanosoma conorhini TaxID=83891 RepID=A0A3R7RXZ1_9TRYP|nr:co-chaperone GrpE [Trypanosoma conorhini]RNF15500.1 co-chaperone GrpE [Trypanosoma conorhini]